MEFFINQLGFGYLLEVNDRRDCIGVADFERCVSCCIIFPFDMAYISCDLRNIFKMTNLMWRIAVWFGRESMGERLVISQNIENSTFHEVSEMFRNYIDLQTALSKVSGLLWFQLL